MLDDQMIRRLRDIRCFLLDMDGTFYLGDRLLEGSLDFLHALARTGRKALFLTNNSSKSAEMYREKLLRMGVADPFLQVYTSGQAAAHYVLQHHAEKNGFLLGNDILRAELVQMGLTFDDISPQYVLVAFDTTLDYAKMTRVCDLIREGLPFIATHPDINCPTETGYVPDTGAILAFIAASTGRKPDVIIGKPNAGIVQGALTLAGIDASACAIAGDRLYTDIAAGLRFGMSSILVLTGETTLDDLRESSIQPDFVFPRLCDIVPYL